MATMASMEDGIRASRGGAPGKACREVVEALLKERRRVLPVPPSLGEGIADPIDEAREREEEAVWLAVLDHSRDVQVAVGEALRHLAVGAYGLCMECGQHIALARLRVLPFAVRCVACQDRLERERTAVARRSAGRAPSQPAPPGESPG